MPRTKPCPFFKQWTPVSTYVLGYWFADGNMYTQKSCGSYVVSIGSKDVEHLEVIRNIIGAGSLIRITGSDVYKLVICRKEMYEDLLRLGGMERKSLVLTWPGVPEAFLPHVVRGYIDGDGSLIWHKSGKSVHPLLSAVGTREFLTGLGTAIQESIGIPMPPRHRKKAGTACVRSVWLSGFTATITGCICHVKWCLRTNLPSGNPRCSTRHI